jgi:DcaP outer membrane protein
MRKTPLQLCFAVILMHGLPGFVLAQDQDEVRALNIKQLQQTLDAQQKQHDVQQTQLDTQEKELHQLRLQLQHLLDGSETNHITPAPAVRIFPRRNDLQTGRRDDDQSLDAWNGSFALNDSDIRIRIGGFLELDVIHDNNAIQSKGQFIADTIPTRNATKLDGTEGQTHFSVSPSRLYIETRTPVADKRLKTFISLDMFANELEVDAEPRLRQAYVELSDILLGGDLLIGQTWSTTTDLESTPDVLDFRGPDALFGQLQPQVRWSKPLADGIRLMLAAETASNHVIEGADSLTRMPDGVMAITWDNHAFNFMGSLLVKDLRASANNGEVASAVGVGVNFSGKMRLPYGEYPNEFMFSVTYGEGIGSHFQNPKPDAVYDAVNNRLEILRLYGVTLAYRHSWNADMTSTVVYCCIEMYNHDAQAPESIQGTEYTSGNVVWNINSHWLLGVEGIWGKRDDKDDAMATVFRTQMTSRVSF